MIDPEVDWYELLGCSIKSTKDEISKAARKQSLKYHPDKNPDPKAQEKFILIQKAKNFLLDDEQRKTYDERISKVIKRKEYDSSRNKSMDEKRKKMRDDLEARVKSNGMKSNINIHVHQQTEQKQPTSASKDEDEIERLRKENYSKMESSTYEARAKAQRAEDLLSHRKNMSTENTGTQSFQVKCKWKRSRESHSDESLYKLFSCHGTIEDVVLVGDKGNAAIITFTTKLAADSAVEKYASSDEYRVTILGQPCTMKAAIFTHQYTHDYQTDLKSQMQKATEKEELLRRIAKHRPFQQQHEQKASSSFHTTSSTYSGNIFTNSHAAAPQEATKPMTVEFFAEKESEILRMMMAAAQKKNEQVS